MTEVVVVAPAKVNLALGVGGLRPDGYHELATVYQAIGRYDEVAVRAAPGFSVEVHGERRRPTAGVPSDGSNLAVRAARLLAARRGVREGVHLRITKGIPVAGGMAGGSADAAAALVACDELWGAGTSRAELSALAAELGSDVPFALVGGTATGRGRGEHVTTLTTQGEFWWVVLESGQGLSTPEVYQELDRMRAGSASSPPRVPEKLTDALRRGDVAALGAALSNDLQPAALRLRPELDQLLTHGRAAFAHGALVAGSGPSCLFLTADHDHAHQVAARLRGHGLGPVSCAQAPVPGARVVHRVGRR